MNGLSFGEKNWRASADWLLLLARIMTGKELFVWNVEKTCSLTDWHQQWWQSREARRWLLDTRTPAQWAMRTLLWQQPCSRLDNLCSIHDTAVTIKISSDSPKYFPFLEYFSLASHLTFDRDIVCRNYEHRPSVVASDVKLEAVLELSVASYGHNCGRGYLAWLLTA